MPRILGPKVARELIEDLQNLHGFFENVLDAGTVPVITVQDAIERLHVRMTAAQEKVDLLVDNAGASAAQALVSAQLTDAPANIGAAWTAARTALLAVSASYRDDLEPWLPKARTWDHAAKRHVPAQVDMTTAPTAWRTAATAARDALAVFV